MKHERRQVPNRDRAVALQYENAESLPKIVAAGVGELAHEIVRLAEQNKIPVHQDTNLTELLARVGVGEAISPESYRLVAEVICFLGAADQEWAASKGLPK